MQDPGYPAAGTTGYPPYPGNSPQPGFNVMPQQAGGYPPQGQQGQHGYPPQSASAYPPGQAGYPQQGSYPQPGYGAGVGYPPQAGGAPLPPERTGVLILGGGMAGVMAAHTLKSAGMNDFLLIEAAGRLGGRVSTTTFCGRTIEQGANWIHGMEKKNNPLMALAHACHLKHADSDFYDNYECTARDSTGRDVTKELKKALKAVEKAEERMYDKADDIEEEGELHESSVKHALTSLGGWRAQTPIDYAAEFFQLDFVEAKPSHEVSLVGNVASTQEEVFGEEDVLVLDPEGFSKVIRHLAEQTFAANDPRLRLNELVTEVHFALENDQYVPADLRNDGVYVKTATGRTYWARACIITFPHAVLLSGSVAFYPPLPDWKARALRQCETAVYNKIFVKFADNVRPFWDQTEWIVYVDSEPVQAAGGQYFDSVRSMSPAVQSALRRGEPFSQGYFTVWMNLSIKGIHPGSNMLMVVVVDEMAKAVELKSDAELKTEITNVLRRMYGPQVPEPEAIHCTKWYSNPLARGSFHIMRDGCTKADLQNLSRGVKNLYFAGDGAGVEFHGFLHNAYITGQKKAREVLDKLGVRH